MSPGQLVSDTKSSVYFSSNTLVEDKVLVYQNFGIKIEALNDKYLRLPAMVDVDRSDSFEYPLDRINQLVNGGEEKLLSTWGKETLVSHVECSMLIFAR